MKNKTRIPNIILAIIMITSLLSGCSNSSSVATVTTESIGDMTAGLKTTQSPDMSVTPLKSNAPQLTSSPSTLQPVASNSTDSLSATQRNSVSTLNYLAELTRDINSSRNSRLFLEEAYFILLNNTHPNAVDETTQNHINFLFDTLQNYRMIAIKRNRLQFIYEQNRAQAMREAVPNLVCPQSLYQPVS